VDGDARLLRDLLLVRIAEEEIAKRYPEQEMRCPTHLCIGQEATAVGVCSALLETDVVLSGHRSHGHYLAKGGDLTGMFAEIYGRATGCSRGKGGSMHLIDQKVGFLGAVPIVGSTIPMAVGAAFGFVLRGEPRVAVVFFGDAAVEEGVFHESLAFAMLERLPVVFVCENNLYSVQTPLSVRQPTSRTIGDLARGHGMRVELADGNDVFAVRAAAARAVEQARGGGGPTFLELPTYRWLEHVGPDEDERLGYRSAGEVRAWKARCPVAHAERVLVERATIDAAGIALLRREALERVERAFDAAKAAPGPAPAELFADVFASSRTPIDRERA
jgi:pyruvate dehydrogenase E1 component alpha subunit